MILRAVKFEDEESRSFDRLFPNQDELTGRGLGNLIALPLQGQSVQKGHTVFLDPENQFEPYEDQWKFLRSIKKVGKKRFDELAALWKLAPMQSRTKPPETLGSRKGLERVIGKCDFIRYCVDNAESLREPLWYCMISNLAVFKGGKERIHEFSKPYPRYSWRETEAAISQALTHTSPHRCETIRKDGFNCEKDCNVKSPAGLGYRLNSDKKGG